MPKLKEENDTTEKTEMAETQLHFIHYAAEEILDYIDDGGEVEEWYQNKLSKVHSDMESLHSYIEGESRRTGMKEEVVTEDLDVEAIRERITSLQRDLKAVTGNYPGDDRNRTIIRSRIRDLQAQIKASGGKKSGMKEEVSKTADAPKMVRDRKTGEMYDPKKKFKELMDKPETKAVMNRLAKEDVEQIDESLSDWKNEITRVHGDDVKFSKEKHKDGKTHHTTATSKSGKQVGNYVHSGSMQGGRVMNKSGAKVYGEEAEQIDELSKKTLGNYIKSATHDVAAKGAATRQFAIDSSRQSGEQDYDAARKSMAKSDKTFSKSWKRRDNMAKAVDRLTKEEIEQIDEKNVPTSPEKWAQAKSQAKAKFDVYPSAYANGWAAKKYKEMGGGWKSVNEEKNDAPFEGGKPVSSKKSVVPGKFGVGFSTAKHLAKTAMKKQSDKMKKPVKEEASPKVKIVKDIMKKKKQESADTFQKDPIISKSEVRM
jgi:hypothetical protein